MEWLVPVALVLAGMGTFFLVGRRYDRIRKED